MAEIARHPETRDVWPRALMLFGASLLAFLTVSALLLNFIFDTASSWPAPGAASQDSGASPALQRSPEADLAAFREKTGRELATLGWVDRAGGIAHIPIEDAMRLVAEGGLPDRSKDAAGFKDECALLDKAAPRSPQAGACREGAANGQEARP
jgi:hypothetical protein